MPFLRVVCYVCGASWNYYDEKYYLAPMLTTAVSYQGYICPKCGSIGVIACGVDTDANFGK